MGKPKLLSNPDYIYSARNYVKWHRIYNGKRIEIYIACYY